MNTAAGENMMRTIYAPEHARTKLMITELVTVHCAASQTRLTGTRRVEEGGDNSYHSRDLLNDLEGAESGS